METKSKIFNQDEISLRSPFRLFCIGPSGSGKTTFLKDLLQELNTMTDKPVNNVVYCYANYQPLYDKMKKSLPNIIFLKGFPAYLEKSFLSDPQNHDLVIIDDLLDTISDDKLFRDMYIGNSHHKNYSVITVVQNLFYKSKFLRTCSLQCTGFVLFKNSRDQSMISNLARQICPNRSKIFLDIYEQITSCPHKYMYIDFSPDCHPLLQFRGNILPSKNLDVYISYE